MGAAEPERGLIDMKSSDFPEYPAIGDALLALLVARGGSRATLIPRECYGPLADLFALTQEQRRRPRPDGRGGSAWENSVQWSRQLLVNQEKLDGSVRGIWQITSLGKMQANRSPFLARLR
jgi:restriction endonuclease Mrr